MKAGMVSVGLRVGLHWFSDIYYNRKHDRRSSFSFFLSLYGLTSVPYDKSV